MVSGKPVKAGGGSGGGLKPALTSLDLSDGMDTGRTYHCPHCGNKDIVRCGKCHGITCYDGSGSFVCVHCGNSGAVSGTIKRIEVQRTGIKAEPGVKPEPGVKAEPGYGKRGPRW